MWIQFQFSSEDLYFFIFLLPLYTATVITSLVVNSICKPGISSLDFLQRLKSLLAHRGQFFDTCHLWSSKGLVVSTLIWLVNRLNIMIVYSLMENLGLLSITTLAFSYNLITHLFLQSCFLQPSQAKSDAGGRVELVHPQSGYPGEKSARVGGGLEGCQQGLA